MSGHRKNQSNQASVSYWIGYKAHFTETCDEDLPRLITQVTTTIGPIPDRHALPEIYNVLEQRELLPEQHLVDAGYVDAEALLASQTTHQVDLVGPTAKDYRWQAREQNGYALADFSIDWEQKPRSLPARQTSSSWTPTRTRNQEVNRIKFGYATCGHCPVRAQCTRSKRRTLSVRRHEAYVALEAARQREQTEEFTELYAERAGIEGVHAEASSSDGIAQVTLYWRTAHPSPACGNCSCSQFMPVTWVVDRRFSTSHSSFSFCSLHEGDCLRSLIDFATNINLRMSQDN